MEIVMPLVDRAFVLDLGKALAQGCPPIVRDERVIDRLSRRRVTVLLEVRDLTTAYHGLVAISTSLDRGGGR